MKQRGWTEKVLRAFRRALIAEWAVEVAMGGTQLLLVSMVSQTAGGLSAGEIRMEYIIGALISVCGMAFLSPALSYLRGKLAARSTIDLQTSLFKTALRQKWSSFRLLGHQEYLNRLTGDVYEYRSMLFVLTADMAAKIVLLIGAGTALFQLDQMMTVVCMLLAGFPALLPLMTRRSVEQSDKKMKRCREKLFAFRNEAIERRESVYVNGLMSGVHKKEDQLSCEYMMQFRKHQARAQAVEQGSEFLNAFMWMVILLMCAANRQNPQVTVMFIGSFGIIRGYLQEILGMLQDVGRYRATKQRIDEMTSDTEQETAQICHGDTALIWRDVDISYGEKQVLRGFSGMIQAGEKVALMGENGSGKSSFLRCLMGLMKPDCGEIQICGNKITALTTRQLRRLMAACLTEGVCLEGRFRENILLTKDVRQERLEELAVELEAEDLMDRDGTFSGGEIKRMELMRTFAQEKILYLFDEPETMLDQKSKEGFIRLMKTLPGIVLVATHDREVALACDRIIRI